MIKRDVFAKYKQTWLLSADFIYSITMGSINPAWCMAGRLSKVNIFIDFSLHLLADLRQI